MWRCSGFNDGGVCPHAAPIAGLRWRHSCLAALLHAKTHRSDETRGRSPISTLPLDDLGSQRQAKSRTGIWGFSVFRDWGAGCIWAVAGAALNRLRHAGVEKLRQPNTYPFRHRPSLRIRHASPEQFRKAITIFVGSSFLAAIWCAHISSAAIAIRVAGAPAGTLQASAPSVRVGQDHSVQANVATAFAGRAGRRRELKSSIIWSTSCMSWAASALDACKLSVLKGVGPSP